MVGIEGVSSFSGLAYNEGGKTAKKVAEKKNSLRESITGEDGGASLFEMTYTNAAGYAKDKYSFLQKTVELMIVRQAEKSGQAATNLNLNLGGAAEVDQEKILAEAMMKDPQWGAEAVAGRILAHARKLAEQDQAKAEMLLGAFKKGYEAAEAAWGGDLPEVCRKTYELVAKGFEEWLNHDGGKV